MNKKLPCLVSVAIAERLIGELLDRRDAFWGAVIAAAATARAFPDTSPETVDANVLALTGVKVDRTRYLYAVSVLKNMGILEDNDLVMTYRVSETKQELAYRLFHPDIENPLVHQELVDRLMQAAKAEDSWNIPL